ncbi:hypothetical protein EZV62_004194 [Acer yangbiense]|uniref:CCHC-type domain-containing protein n=1 Tax=Acer yangbiense TaxID=1000413 RepID=A0A5C7IJL3_9ROSI|nr:hypothetical protein EZV62_004194 [Acer yangbiense]
MWTHAGTKIKAELIDTIEEIKVLEEMKARLISMNEENDYEIAKLKSSDFVKLELVFEYRSRLSRYECKSGLAVLGLANMSANEIARLCENLSIKDEDREIHQISEDVGEEGVQDVDHCLVGKVLSGKRVNREAFISVIEHLWNPFGKVEIESVGENVFMFHFQNPEDRSRVWQRGPWHFDKSLIVLEMPEGTGEIAKLRFNKADFWVQIHDIPIMCMNRRSAKWLAEQIGEVIEIPSESRDCWGKFLRVKVRIDISRPLKRWLRLSLDKSGNVVVVGLKYERMPEFCFACGRVGHGINECSDIEAKKEAMEGNNPRFGLWMRAPTTDKPKDKSSSQLSGGSSVRDKSMGSSQEVGKRGFLAIEMGPNSSQGKESFNSGWETRRTAVEKPPETLTGGTVEEQAVPDQMCVEDSRSGPIGPDLNKAQAECGNREEKREEAHTQREMDPIIIMDLEKPTPNYISSNESSKEPSQKMETFPTSKYDRRSLGNKPAGSHDRPLLERTGTGESSYVRSLDKAAQKVFPGGGFPVRNEIGG